MQTSIKFLLSATFVLFAQSFVLAVHAADFPSSDAFEPVTLEPLPHLDASLTLISPTGEKVAFTPAELEQLGSYQLITTTPWRESPAIFEGAMLSDVLQTAGLTGMSIQVVAENDYAVVIEKEVLASMPILVATRVNGKAHTRRERGPLQFVMNMKDFEKNTLAGERHWVWMAATIKPRTE